MELKDLLRIAFNDGIRYGKGKTDLNFRQHIESKEYIELIKTVDNNRLSEIITPFWLWLVKEAKIEVIDAHKYIEVHGFIKDGDVAVPVISFDELIELYKEKTK